MKLTLSQAVLLQGQKSQDKKLNILKTKRAFEVKQKPLFIIFKELAVANNDLRHESAPLSFGWDLTEITADRGNVIIAFIK